MVVGVEELGHVERARALGAARHRKVLVEPAQGAEARGGESEVEGPVEDLVVQGAVEPDERDAGVGLDFERDSTGSDLQGLEIDTRRGVKITLLHRRNQCVSSQLLGLHHDPTPA